MYLDAQIISVCHTLSYQSHSEYPERCTNRHFDFYSSYICMYINIVSWIHTYSSPATFHHHHHHHHLYLKRPFLHAQLGLDVPPKMKPLHISLNTAHSGCKPSTFISSFTHSYQAFLLLPAHLTPPPPHFYRSTHNYPLTFHMPKPPQSTLPHHLYTQKTV